MKMKLKAVAKYKDGGKSITKKEDGDDNSKDKLQGRSGQKSTNVKVTGDQTKKEEVQKAAGIKGDSRLKVGQPGYDAALKDRTMKLKAYSKQTIDQRADATSKAKSEQSAETTVKKAGLASENKDTQTTKTKAYVDKTKAREQAIKDEDKKDKKAKGAKKMKLKMGSKNC
jgi:hypothetical protein